MKWKQASGYPQAGGEGKRRKGGRTEVGEPHWPRVEKAEPLFSSQAGGRGHLRAFEQWGDEGTGHYAQLASDAEPALGMKPYPLLAPAPLSCFFFSIRSNQSESEKPSFLLGSV